MRKWLIVILFLGLSIGCETYSDYPDVKGEGSFYLECFPTSGSDSTVLTLYKTRPVNKSSVSNSWDNVRVELEINDSSVMWSSSGKEGSGIRFSARTDLAEGDAIKLVIQDAGKDPVIARRNIPSPPSYTYWRELTSSWNDRYHILLDNRGEEGRHYYGICLEAKFSHVTHFSDGRTEIKEEPMRDLRYGMKGPDGSLDLSGKVEGRFKSVMVAGKKMIVFEVEEDEGTSYEVIVDTPNIEDRTEWIYMGVPSRRSAIYQLNVFRLSSSAYHFLVPRENEVLIGAGLVPPFDVQGNLKNAFGMVECMGGLSTGWLPAISQDEN